MTPIDAERLAAWMDAAGVAAGPITDVEPLAGGTQNVLVRFRRGRERFVLRRPPVHQRADSDETMRREARVLTALAGTDVPHPRLIAACEDQTVLGAAFYVMEEVDGANPTVELPSAYVDSSEWRHRFGLAMADGAAAIGALDHVAAGLDGLGTAAGFLERQVPRWHAQLDSYRELPNYPGPELPGIDEIAVWLEANRPASWEPGLIHGDYHVGNVIVDVRRPRLAAIIDWELSTIGDPLLDLGWLLATWPDDVDAPAPTLTVRPWAGFPTAAELVARYGERSRRDLSAIAWYEVLACFKLGIIVEGTHARACAGLAPLATGRALHETACRLLQRAERRVSMS